MTAAMSFRFGPSGPDRFWLRSRAGRYFRTDRASLRLLFELNDGVSIRKAARTSGMGEDAVTQLSDWARRSGLIAEAPEGAGIEKVCRFQTPVSLNGFLYFLVLTIALQALYISGLAANYSLRNLSEVPPVFALACLAIVFHEVGHYAALCPYTRPRFGLTWFLFLPVVYVKSDVLWELHRSRRLAVNLAGLFADSVFNSAAIFAVLCRPELERWVTPLLLTQYIRWMLFLNPLLQNDGYWILSDVFDIVNLSVRGKRSVAEKRPGVFYFYGITQALFWVVIIASIILLFYHLAMKVLRL